MLAERLSLLLDLLDVTPSELSEYADLDRTMISRLKNGKRTPQKTSPSIEKLSHGICLYADEHDLMGLIFDTLNTPPNFSVAGGNPSDRLALCRNAGSRPCRARS